MATSASPKPVLSAGPLDDGTAWLEQPLTLGVLHHREPDPVLDARAGVEELHLRQDGARQIRRERVETHERGVADGVEDAVVPHGGSGDRGIGGSKVAAPASGVKRNPGAHAPGACQPNGHRQRPLALLLSALRLGVWTVGRRTRVGAAKAWGVSCR